jgi:hypothetical protein
MANKEMKKDPKLFTLMIWSKGHYFELFGLFDKLGCDLRDLRERHKQVKRLRQKKKTTILSDSEYDFLGENEIFLEKSIFDLIQKKYLPIS